MAANAELLFFFKCMTVFTPQSEYSYTFFVQ